jgi:hypothetical protein
MVGSRPEITRTDGDQWIKHPGGPGGLPRRADTVTARSPVAWALGVPGAAVAARGPGDQVEWLRRRACGGPSSWTGTC